MVGNVSGAGPAPIPGGNQPNQNDQIVISNLKDSLQEIREQQQSLNEKALGAVNDAYGQLSPEGQQKLTEEILNQDMDRANEIVQEGNKQMNNIINNFNS